MNRTWWAYNHSEPIITRALQANFRLLLPKRLLNCASKISFKKYKQKVLLFVIYLFNYHSSKSTLFMLNVPFDFALSTVFASKLEFVAIQRLQKHSSFLTCVLMCSNFWEKVNCSSSRWYFSILLWHLYQSHTFSNNPNDGEISLDVWTTL